MGSSSSTCTSKFVIADNLSGETTSGVGGQKSTPNDTSIINDMTVVSPPTFSTEGVDDVLVNYGVVSLIDEDESEEESDSDSENESEDEIDVEEKEADLFLLERKRILADARELKRLAAHFLRPELGVASTDGASFGRNYFNRPSAPETEEDEYADERAEILADALALKKSAIDYLHPEVGVKSTDGAAFGRNYFNRPSAPEMEDEDADEIAAILANAQALKQSAIDYLHPEVGVMHTDGACFGRNYFERPSAPARTEASDTKMVQKDLDIFAELSESVKSASIHSSSLAKTVAGKLASDSGGTEVAKSASEVMLFGLSDGVQ